MAIDDLGEGVREVTAWVDAAQFAGLDQRRDDDSILAADARCPRLRRAE